MSLHPPSEYATRRAAFRHTVRPKSHHMERRLLPWGFVPFSVSPLRAAACVGGIPGPVRQRLQVFSTSWRLKPPRACRPIFQSRIRSWGSPFRALLLPCSRTPSPAPVPSCRSNVLAESSFEVQLPMLHRNDAPTCRPLPEALGTPSPSGLCSTRESATARRRFRPTRARSSPGLHPLQGVPPRRKGIGLHRCLPSWDCPTGRRIDRPDAPPGCRYATRLACLSRGCRPSWGFPPSDLPRWFDSVPVRESPPRAPGCVAVPSSSPL
jgi:hypothetical protein